MKVGGRRRVGAQVVLAAAGALEAHVDHLSDELSETLRGMIDTSTATILSLRTLKMRGRRGDTNPAAGRRGVQGKETKQRQKVKRTSQFSIEES